MNDEELLRYSRQILLAQIGIEGQRRLAAGRVLLIGVGGLGSPAAMYLAAAGVGELVLSDPDRVDLANLQRQLLYTTEDIGTLKVEAARQRLLAMNPQVRVRAVGRRLTPEELAAQAAAADVVVDGSDNFETRFAVNRACVAARTPLVSGAVIRLEGQAAVFRLDRPGGPCYRCLYPEADEAPEPCTQGGILGPVAGIIGAVQATEAVKLIAGFGEPLAGRLLVLDAAAMQWREIALRRDPGCPVCAEAARAGAAR